MFVCLQRLRKAWGIEIKDKDIMLSETLLCEKSKQIVCEKKDLPVISFGMLEKRDF